MLIKNQTPYEGSIKLKFEKFPYYSSNRGVLNKVHLDLGFTKLVSRLDFKKEEKNGSISVALNSDKVALINMLTGGRIGLHEWWVVEGTNGRFESKRMPSNKKDIVFHGSLENSFITSEGDYIGDAERGWWYYKNKFYVCKEYPQGVAIKLKTYSPVIKLTNTINDSYVNFITEQIDNDNIEGYYGYTHRGGSLFKIGDRLFDENYKPSKSDYTPEEWDNFCREHQKSLKKADPLDKKWMEEDGISYVIPFNKRGRKVIETLEEAREAAINMSKYLS